MADESRFAALSDEELAATAEQMVAEAAGKDDVWRDLVAELAKRVRAHVEIMSDTVAIPMIDLQDLPRYLP